MIVYNIVAEYASLFVVLVILISFVRDYDTQTKTYQFLRLVYIIVLLSGISTVAAIEFGVPGEGKFHILRAYIANTLYFMLLPAVSLCYVIYSSLIATIKLNKKRFTIRAIICSLPYVGYLALLLPNITNGRVFSVTETEGYVRGEWYQLPYVIVAVNIFMVMIMTIIHRKKIYKEVQIVMCMTVIVSIFILGLQAITPNTIMTGLVNTVSILSIHLYIQNVGKSTDPLTSLNNRISLMYRLAKWVKKEHDFSMYIFSIRSFKMINERYGLAFGDKVLIYISNGFSSCFSEQQVYRYNGDEFAILIKKKTRKMDEALYKIVGFLEKPFIIDDNKVKLDFTYARVDNKIFGKSVNDLISAADYSISLLKSGSLERKFLYDPEIVKEIIEKNTMIEHIKYAIEHSTFVVHYQPIYDSHNKSFVQAEALVRMRDKIGLIHSPDEFIDIAEKTGLIVPMTYQVLEQVCLDYRKLLTLYGNTLTIKSIAVNFPYLQFESPHMIENIDRILIRHDIHPSMIKIEITERALLEDSKMVLNAMDKMVKNGFIFELDDFGVDYSNIHTFLNLPVNIIKLDRSLLFSTMENKQNAGFFGHLVEGIKDTGRITIIEGIETYKQLEFVLENGCDFIQGYYFSKPLDFERFKEFIEKLGQEAE